MGTLSRYHAENLPALLDKISKNSIGMDDYLNRFWDLDTTSNYPPYNIVQEGSVVDIAPLNQIKVLSYKDKGDWILEQKYNIGKKGKTQEE